MYIALIILILALLLLYLGSLSPGLCIAIALFALAYFLRELHKRIQREQHRQFVVEKYKAPYGLTVRYLRGNDFLQMQYLVLLFAQDKISLVAENLKKDYPLENLNRVFLLKFGEIKEALVKLDKSQASTFCALPREVLEYWQSLGLDPLQEIMAMLLDRGEDLSYVLLELKPENEIRDNIEKFMPSGLLLEWSDKTDKLLVKSENAVASANLASEENTDTESNFKDLSEDPEEAVSAFDENTQK